MTMPASAWKEAERKAAASGSSVDDTISSALLAPHHASRHECVDRPLRKGGQPIPDWDEIPQAVAQQLFRALDGAEKCAARLVSRSWAEFIRESTDEYGYTEIAHLSRQRTGRWQRVAPRATKLKININNALTDDGRYQPCPPPCVLEEIPGIEKLESLVIAKESELVSDLSDRPSMPLSEMPGPKLRSLELIGLEKEMDGLMLPSSHCLDQKPALNRFSSSLRKLKIETCILTATHTEALSGMTALEELTIHNPLNKDGNGLADKSVLRPLQLQPLTGLKKLRLLEIPLLQEQGNAFLNAISYLTNLETLHLDGLGNRWDDTEPLDLDLDLGSISEALPHLTKLTSFSSIEHSTYADEPCMGLAVTDSFLAALPSLPNLKCLSLQSDFSSATPNGLKNLALLTGLTYLQIEWANCTDRKYLIDDDFMLNLSHLTGLETLSLGGVHQVSAKLTAQSLLPLTGLVSLSLAYPSLDEDGMFADDGILKPDWLTHVRLLDLSIVKHMPSLKELHANGCLIFQNLGDLSHATTLEEVHLGGLWDRRYPDLTCFEYEDAVRLASLTRLKSLKLDCVVYGSALDERHTALGSMDEAMRVAVEGLGLPFSS